ncbi:MAG: HAD family phosphatase [Gammaproteobacteria bacterium]|nr:HAD family phosphatase [Gammaproteobacteria bacterium]
MEQRKKLDPPTALVFDLDGLLLDTETIAHNAFVEACHEVGWRRTDFDVYVRCIGRHGPEIGDVLKAGYGPDFPWDEIGPITQRRYHEFIDHRPADIKPGADELLAYAAENQISCAVATSSRVPSTSAKLKLSNLARFFPVVVTGDDVAKSKPHPEPYLLAAECLGVSADECWALEDSENGVRSAVSAGCIVFQVPDLVQPSPQLLLLGHQVVNSLHDVLSALKQTIQAH